MAVLERPGFNPWLPLLTTGKYIIVQEFSIPLPVKWASQWLHTCIQDLLRPSTSEYSAHTNILNLPSEPVR